MQPETLQLAGDGLSLDDAERILHGQIGRLGLAPAARKRIDQSRRCLDALIAQGQTIYGVNTGFGKLSNQRIDDDQVLTLQENLLRSHAVGVGQLLDVGVARLALALRIQALAKGYSGVTVELVDQLVDIFNHGVVPAIPEQGSVGASGDLAPLAHLALVVIGEGEALVGRSAKPQSGGAESIRDRYERGGALFQCGAGLYCCGQAAGNWAVEFPDVPLSLLEGGRAYIGARVPLFSSDKTGEPSARLSTKAAEPEAGSPAPG